MSPGHPVIWSWRGSAKVGGGAVEVADPGVGPHRYRRAIQALRESGRETGFASFTFDPGESGSVVLIPESVEAVPARLALGKAGQRPRGTVVSTGVEEWRKGFETAITRLERGEVEKVVLARRVEIEFDGPLDQMTVLNGLGVMSSHSFLFAVGGLVGASPELLISLKDGQAASFPLAGSAATELDLANPKIAREHKLTSEAVLQALTAHLSNLPAMERTTVDLGSIKHLGTSIHGTARRGTTIAELLSSLHPTPAVAGVPGSTALDLIRLIEPHGRGRYAGPVGWFTADGNGEFAVALRCGLVGDNRVILHAGGGLLSGSVMEDELEETELKLGTMLAALGVQS